MLAIIIVALVSHDAGGGLMGEPGGIRYRENHRKKESRVDPGMVVGGAV